MNEQKFPTKTAANRVALNDIQKAAGIDRCFVYHDPVDSCLAVKGVLILVKNKPNQPSTSAALRKNHLSNGRMPKLTLDSLSHKLA